MALGRVRGEAESAGISKTSARNRNNGAKEIFFSGSFFESISAKMKLEYPTIWCSLYRNSI